MPEMDPEVHDVACILMSLKTGNDRWVSRPNSNNHPQQQPQASQNAPTGVLVVPNQEDLVARWEAVHRVPKWPSDPGSLVMTSQERQTSSRENRHRCTPQPRVAVYEETGLPAVAGQDDWNASLEANLRTSQQIQHPNVGDIDVPVVTARDHWSTVLPDRRRVWPQAAVNETLDADEATEEAGISGDGGVSDKEHDQAQPMLTASKSESRQGILSPRWKFVGQAERHRQGLAKPPVIVFGAAAETLNGHQHTGSEARGLKRRRLGRVILPLCELGKCSPRRSPCRRILHHHSGSDAEGFELELGSPVSVPHRKAKTSSLRRSARMRRPRKFGDDEGSF